MCCFLFILLPVAAVLIAGGVALAYSQLSTAALSRAAAMLASRCAHGWHGSAACTQHGMTVLHPQGRGQFSTPMISMASPNTVVVSTAPALVC